MKSPPLTSSLFSEVSPDLEGKTPIRTFLVEPCCVYLWEQVDLLNLGVACFAPYPCVSVPLSLRSGSSSVRSKSKAT